MKKISLFLIVALAITFYRCEWTLEDVPACPKLDNGINYSGSVDGVLTITGQFFGNKKAEIEVFVDNIEFPIDPGSSLTDNTVEVIVPPNATDGLLRVCIDNCCSSDFGASPNFQLTRISVNEVFPVRAKEGETITITGNNFKAGAKEKHLVYFPDLPNAPVQPLSVIDPQTMEVQVPLGAGTGNIRVELDGSSVEGPEFTYLLLATVSPFYGNCEDAKLLCEDPNFIDPVGIAVNNLGEVFVSDQSARQIFIIDPVSRQRSSFAGSPLCFAGCQTGPESGVASRFSKPFGIVVDGSNNLFVTDRSNKQIKKISSSIVVTNYAGGLGTTDCPGAPFFSNPRGIAIDDETIYVADFSANKILKVRPTDPVSVSDHTGSIFNQPLGMTVDQTGKLYVADSKNFEIKVVHTDLSVSRYAGNGTNEFKVDVFREEAGFLKPVDVAVDAKGNLFILDETSNKIIGITPTGWTYTIVGSGSGECSNFSRPGLEATLDTPGALALSSDGKKLYVTERGTGTVKEVSLK